MTLDGKIATRTGDSRWVSGEPARRLVHEVRDRADAVLVGIRTAIADDPELTTRLERGTGGEPGGRTALRIVVDARQVNDREAARLAHDVAKAIEQALTYPGEIKVNVLRETRHIEIAR